VIFINYLEEQLKKSFKINRILDALFKKSFYDLISFIELDLELQSNVEIFSVSKRFKQENQKVEISKNESNENNNEITGWISKFENNTVKKNFFSNKILNLNIKWKYNTNKCVDATPLVLETFADKEIILIGSHSNKFFSLNNDGELVWQFKSDDRIESSAIISSCKQFIIFGLIFCFV
jgi:outer membrane protein assembly factor BamB